MNLAGRALVLGSFLFTAGGAFAQSSSEYSVTYEQKSVGSMTVTAGDARRHVEYGYTVNARGPKYRFEFVLDAAGLPSALEVSGADILGVAAVEHLGSDARGRAWKSPVDEGKVAAGSFYYPFYESPEAAAMLARALLAAPGGMLRLAPAGSASIEQAQSQTVEAGGEALSVQLVLLAGLDFAPMPLWLTADRELFALVDSNLAVVRKGWEASVPQLREAQNRITDARDVANAARLVQTPSGAVLIRNARLFDAEARRMRPGTSVLLKGNRIAAVAPDGGVDVPEGTQVIEAGGAALLPGLWDMHVHLRDNADGILNIANGITTVRDMGNTLANINNWRPRYASGELIGPRVLPAGLIDGKGPNATNGVQVSTAEEVSRAVTLFADNGYVEIKLYGSLPRELVPQAIREAHSRGLRVGGHVPVGLRMDDVVRMGFDDVSHFNFVMLNFLGSDVHQRTNTLARVLEPAAKGSGIDRNSDAVDQLIEAMRAKPVVLDSTALVFENLFGAEPGTLRAAYAPYGDRLPARITRSGRGGGLAKTDAERAIYRASFEHVLPLLKRMHDAGIPIVPGTDGTPGVLLARELELYVQAGIPAVDALQMATLVPARMMKLDGDLGSIEPGKLADLFLVDGDPSVDISAVRNVRLVIRNGTLYDAVALGEAVGIRPRTERVSR